MGEARKMSDASEAAIIESWKLNAAPWTSAVRERRIDSRRRVTDAAILEAIQAFQPKSVIDMGCGEGWLARALAERGVDVLGVDAEPSLVDEARALGGGDFRTMSYADIASGKLDAKADMVVCNFSLLGERSVELLVRAVPALLLPRGVLVVQTLHPREASGELPYEDGWREGSWKGFGPEFSRAAPWYFRTFEGWARLFEEAGLPLIATYAPADVETGKPMSAIFVCAISHGEGETGG
jgi:2-polyprenyl-3-methyl-5-hydroxy-6-metoxy-1,4-benzoquinol methylase